MDNAEKEQNDEKHCGTGNKKKGRPKGLKTNKGKSLLKEENKLEKHEKLNKGHWRPEENKKYHWFLEMYSKHFIMKQLRRMDKIFKTMAEFIGTREAEQCRSHHQKMEKKHESFYKIIRNLRLEFFSSPDPSYIKAELESNEIYDYDPLITEEMLDNENEVVDQVEEKDFDKNCELSLNKPGSNSCLLGDNYENNLKM